MQLLRIIRLLLFPIGMLYGSIMAIRNLLYKTGIFKSTQFKAPVISVGNITVGGTGKTPHTEYIIEQLIPQKKLAVLSRGYGRITKGYVEVVQSAFAAAVGDEPLQIKKKHPKITVAVDEKRVHGINILLSKKNAPDVILLDDAYQHRKVKPGLQILLIDFSRPLRKDTVLPAGDLREFAAGRKRADIIIVTKCPTLFNHEFESWKSKYLAHENQHMFFSGFEYKNLKPVFSNGKAPDITELKNFDILAVSGIANPSLFEDHLSSTCKKLHCIRFNDHHQFTENDIKRIRSKFESIASQKKAIITTEKDAMRLKDFASLQNNFEDHLFYLPVGVKILFGQGDALNKLILNYVQQYS